MHELLLILEHFGGGKGGAPGSDPVRFLLAAFFWWVLALVAWFEWRRSANRRDGFVLFAALFGVGRELLMFSAEYGGYRGLVQFRDIYRIYPPLEHALTMLSYLGITFAFMWYSFVNARVVKTYLWIFTPLIIILYLFIAPGWIRFVGQNPGIPFGAYAGDMLFRVAASMMLAVALAALYQARRQGQHVSLWLLAAIGCFFGDEFLMILNLAGSERYVEIFAPIRHNLHIWAIPMLICSYWTELRNHLKDAAREAQAALEARIEAQSALQRNEARYRSLIENLPVGIALVDQECRITMVNRKMSELFLRPAKSFIGQFCNDHFDSCAEICPDCSAAEPRWPRQVSQLETEGLRADGSRFALNLTILPLLHQGSQSTGFIEMVEDITDKKRAEAEKNQLQEHLRHAEKMEAIGYLAGGVAHDFNNQLTGVLGYAELLLLRLEDGRLKAYAQQIKDSANRSAALIQQLLAFGRKGKYLSVPVSIEQTLEEVISLLKRSIDKRIRIEKSLYNGPAQVIGDPAQLQSALLNIALNARDAMPEGGTVTFETAPFTPTPDWKHGKSAGADLPETTYLQISVKDTGRGMGPEILQHIFEPFFTTKEAGKGTGMGLASVYGTLANHQGHIDVESGAGKGTTVRLYLPLTTDQPEEVEPQPNELVRGTARILLVDDEASVRGVATEMLEALGYQVHECRDGQAALEYYRQAWPEIDLVILDMIMPVLDGRDTFLAMKKINPELRAILCSGYSLEGSAQELLTAGQVGFVGKPFSVAELSEHVAQALSMQ